MELISNRKEVNTPGHVLIADVLPEIVENIQIEQSVNEFIQANTTACTLNELTLGHIIPVFIKDNEPVISHNDFVQTAMRVVSEVFHSETILSPNIRISHPVKGRIPEARNKPSIDLLEHEKTIYYERMAFTIEVPSIHTIVDGNKLNLTIGGVKAYNLDNLYARSGTDQHFKVFIGFKNMVCTNLCVSTDGYIGNLKVKNIEQLYNAIFLLLKDYNSVELCEKLTAFSQYSLTEKEFANLVGRCRMYRHMPENKREELPELKFGDSQINAICKDYYADNSFCSAPDGSINLWKLYNLLTNANKSSYVDYFMDRNVNAFELVQELQTALQNQTDCWYLN